MKPKKKQPVKARKVSGEPRPMPPWLAEAMKVACLTDHINAIPWWKRWTVGILVFFRIKHIPDFAIPPGWNRTKPASDAGREEGKK